MRRRLESLGKKKFVRDTLVLQAASVVQNGTYLVTSLLTARLLGKFELGRWNTSRELYMLLFFLVNMGLTNAAVSRYSHAKGSGDERGSVLVLASLLKLGFIVSALVLALGWLVAPYMAEHYYEDLEIGHITSVLCYATFGEVLRSLTLAVLNGTRQMRQYALFDVTTNVLRVLLVGLALWVNPAPMSVAWAFFTQGVIAGGMGIIAYGRARKAAPELAPPPLLEVLAAVPGAPLASFFGLSFLLALSKAMNSVVPRLGMLFIPAVAVASAQATQGFEDNGAYGVGTVLTMVLTGAIGAIASNVLPTLGLKMGKSDVPIGQLGSTLRRLSLYSGGLAVGATLVSVPFAWLVIRYGYGESYMVAFDYYLWLATGNLFTGFAVIVEPFYIYARRMHHHVAQSLVYATLATMVIFSATKLWGPMGAAAAGGLCRGFVLFHLVYIAIYFRRVGKSTSSNGPTGTTSASRPGPDVPGEVVELGDAS